MNGAVHRARVASSGAVLAERLRLAHTPWARLRGLLGTKGLDPGEGLWLRPCRQIHMFGMRYAVDAVFLDARQRVVRALPDFAPGRVSPHVRDAESVLELPAGTVERAGLAEGTQVVIEGEPVAPLTGRGGRLATAFGNLALAALYALFVAAHVSRARGTVNVALAGHLAIIVQMTILAVLFVVRRPSTDTSDRPLDWVLGIVGTFLPLLLRRADTPGGLVWLGAPIQVVGASAVAVVALFLGRSFGLVPANRGLKLEGPYRLVRHPMYGAHLVGCLMVLSISQGVAPDLWGHVRYGQDALAASALPATATHTYTAVGHPWINHENLAELTFGWIETHWGAAGLNAFISLLGLLLLGLMVRNAVREGASFLVLSVAILLATCAIGPGWSIRPQVFTYTFFALLLVILGRAFRHDVRPDARALWLAPPLVALSAHTHGGFTPGPAAFSPSPGCPALP